MAAKLAIVAGTGILPLIAAKKARQQGVDFHIYPVAESVSAQGHFTEFTGQLTVIQITKFGAFLKRLKHDKITQLVFLGKTSKEVLFQDFKFDLKAVKVLAKMVNKNDDNIFFAIEAELRRIGIEVIAQKLLLEDLLLPEKVYSLKKPRKQDRKDIEFGLYYSKKIGELDIGQTVVVRNESVLAVEAIEGTDECIKRGGSLARKKGAVVCKTEKVSQDERFDVPTIGVDTINTMYESGCHVLAIEAGCTFVVTPKEVIDRVNKLGMIFVAKNLDGKPALL